MKKIPLTLVRTTIASFAPFMNANLKQRWTVFLYALHYGQTNVTKIATASRLTQANVTRILATLQANGAFRQNITPAWLKTYFNGVLSAVVLGNAVTARGGKVIAGSFGARARAA